MRKNNKSMIPLNTIQLNFVSVIFEEVQKKPVKELFCYTLYEIMFLFLFKGDAKKNNNGIMILFFIVFFSAQKQKLPFCYPFSSSSSSTRTYLMMVGVRETREGMRQCGGVRTRC